MTNKVIIGILVFLVILSGALCAHAYTLSQQLNAMSKQLTVFQEEQSTRISTLSDKLASHRQETITRIVTLEDNAGEAVTRLGILDDEITVLEDEITGIATKFSQPVLDANKIYQTASKAIARLSDGQRTVGSGFILDTKAHVVTAHHVVEHLSEIYVILPDGRISAATITGSCKYSDIAILTLHDELVIEPLILADSTAVKIGEPVVTIGNPFELTETITSGIISQLNRFVEVKYDSQTRWVANIIQFDAAINFGNSGSPLLNSEGEVIGIVIARVEPEQGDGLYYAVSSNKVKRVIISLIEQGFFDYPWLGVEITNLTPQIVQARGLETTNGVLVKTVFTESPAQTAGIKVDDIIAAVDGVTVKDVADLTSYLGENKSPDEPVTLSLIRDVTELELSFKIGTRQS